MSRRRGPIPVSTVSIPKTDVKTDTKLDSEQGATPAETAALQGKGDSPPAQAADSIPKQPGGDQVPAETPDGDKRPSYLRNFGGDQEQQDAIEALRLLAQELPADADVREVDDDDTSPLEDVERQQRERTEHVIQEAMRTGNAVVWVLAQGVSLAVKGKWHRDTGQSLDDYVKGLTNRSASYFRRLRQATPLALEAAERFGKILVPGPSRDLLKIEQQHGRTAALDLYNVLQRAGGQASREITAAVIAKAGDALPAALPEDEEEVAVIYKEAAQAALSVPIGTLKSSAGSKGAGGSSAGAVTRIPVTVTKELSDTLDQWATSLTESLHGLTISKNDVIAHSLALAASHGQESLGLLAARIEQQHATHVGKGVIRFEWRSGGYARSAERRAKGQYGKWGETPYPCAHEEKGANGPPCEQAAIWKITRTRRKQTAVSYYCDAHLPETDTPPGRWEE